MCFGVGALILFVVHVSIQFVMGRFGSSGKKVEEKTVNDSMLNRATANGGTNNGIEVGCIMRKNNSILSESTVQEKLESPKGEEVAKQSPKMSEKNDGKAKGDFTDVSLAQS